MERVVAYVDGFNLYFGLKSKGWKRYYWLDIRELAINLLKPNQQLMGTKYFTARIAGPPDKVRRQAVFIEALETLSGFEIFYGVYQVSKRACPLLKETKCPVPQEKMTDVNIAVELLKDAFQDKFDTALLISADSDLTPPVKAVISLFPRKRVVVVFPPDRRSGRLGSVATARVYLGRRTIAKSLFPERVQTEDGHLLICPKQWK